MVSPTHKKWLRVRYPNIIEKGVCDNGHASHAWNRFSTSLDIEKFVYKSLQFTEQCHEQRGFFRVSLDIDLW